VLIACVRVIVNLQYEVGLVDFELILCNNKEWPANCPLERGCKSIV
jgi:hypothetical protein